MDAAAFLAAALLTLGFLAGCEPIGLLAEADGSGAGDHVKTVTITGIPSEHNGKMGMIKISKDVAPPVTAGIGIGAVENGTLTLPLTLTLTADTEIEASVSGSASFEDDFMTSLSGAVTGYTGYGYHVMVLSLYGSGGRVDYVYANTDIYDAHLLSEPLPYLLRADAAIPFSRFMCAEPALPPGESETPLLD
jgi:hypothetical protein